MNCVAPIGPRFVGGLVDDGRRRLPTTDVGGRGQLVGVGGRRRWSTSVVDVGGRRRWSSRWSTSVVEGVTDELRGTRWAPRSSSGAPTDDLAASAGRKSDATESNEVTGFVRPIRPVVARKFTKSPRGGLSYPNGAGRTHRRTVVAHYTHRNRLGATRACSAFFVQAKDIGNMESPRYAGMCR